MPTQVKLNNLSEIYSYFRKWDSTCLFRASDTLQRAGVGAVGQIL